MVHIEVYVLQKWHCGMKYVKIVKLPGNIRVRVKHSKVKPHPITIFLCLVFFKMPHISYQGVRFSRCLLKTFGFWDSAVPQSGSCCSRWAAQLKAELPGGKTSGAGNGPLHLEKELHGLNNCGYSTLLFIMLMQHGYST